MSRIVWTTLLLTSIFVFGCGRKSRTETAPLTIEDWTVLPAETKFEFRTIDRWKAGTTKFRDDSEWDRFAHAVVIPAQKKELPNGPQKK